MLRAMVILVTRHGIVAALNGDTAYIKAIDKIWDNMVGKKCTCRA